MNETEYISIPRHRLLRLRGQASDWWKAAIGLLVLSLAGNMALSGLYRHIRLQQEAEISRYRQELQTAETMREQAVQALGALTLEVEREQESRAEQAAAFEAAGAWTYIGECTVTSYCPCAECCGRWADGLTAAGVPATDGIVAVDPAVIPLGSTVIIDGQKYLAADTGVTGLHVDICRTSHQQAEADGVRAADVWVISGGAP